MVIEPDVLPEDIYPFKMVDDVANGVKGSCMHYESRSVVGF